MEAHQQFMIFRSHSWIWDAGWIWILKPFWCWLSHNALGKSKSGSVCKVFGSYLHHYSSQLVNQVSFHSCKFRWITQGTQQNMLSSNLRQLMPHSHHKHHDCEKDDSNQYLEISKDEEQITNQHTRKNHAHKSDICDRWCLSAVDVYNSLIFSHSSLLQLSLRRD